MNRPDDPSTFRTGLMFGVGAHLFWGIVTVIFFKLLPKDAPLEIVGQRVVWSLVFVLIILAFRDRLRSFRRTLRERRLVVLLGFSGTLVALNWLTFIYAVSVDELVQVSLGYFMTPLVNVALALIVLRERLRPAQWIAVGLAAAAVGRLMLAAGPVPWIAFVLAGTFGVYGLIRKRTPIDTVNGLGVECLVLLPAGLAAFAFGVISHDGLINRLIEADRPGTLALVALSGAVTAIPLLLFGAAARRLPLSTLGFCQYIGPTCHLLLATLCFKEAVSAAKWQGFALIWLALVVYTIDAVVRSRPASAAPVAVDPGEAG